MNIIDKIVSIQVSRSKPALTPSAFNIMLFIGETNHEPQVKAYSSFDEVTSDYDTGTPEYLAAQAYFGQSSVPSKMYIGQTLSTGESTYQTIAVAYDAIKQEINDFYGIAISSKDSAVQEVIAGKALADKKMFICSSSDANILDGTNTTNIAYKLRNTSNSRSAVMYSSDADKYPECAWYGLIFPKEMNATWAYKVLAGISPDNFNTTEYVALILNHTNFFTRVVVSNVAIYGTTADGSYLDLLRGIDLLTNNLQVSVINLLINTDIVPYTTQGISMVDAALREALNALVERGIILKGSYVITMPDISEIPETDKINRILDKVKVNAIATNGIHQVKINVTIGN